LVAELNEKSSFLTRAAHAELGRGLSAERCYQVAGRRVSGFTTVPDSLLMEETKQCTILTENTAFSLDLIEA
jgi:hypothetical protein